MKYYITLLILYLLCQIQVVQADRTTVRIGAVIPFSGPLSHVGIDIKRGISLGIKDYSGGNLKFKVIYEDSRHEAATAVIAAQKLLKQDDVDIILSLWDTSDAIAPLAEADNTPHIGIRWNPEIAKRFNYTFTMESTYQSYIESLVKLLKALGKNSIYLLTEEAQGWILASDYLRDNVKNYALTILGEDRLNGSNDPRTAVLKAGHANADIVVILTNPPLTQNVLRRFKEISPNQAITAYSEVIDPKLVEGIPFVAQFDTQAWFNDKFIKEFGEPFNSRAPHGYDLIALISKAYEGKSSPLQGEELLKSLLNIKSFNGATGKVSISSEKTIESACVWKVAKNGKFEKWEANR